MIELRVEMLLNESEGLGFPSSWQNSGGVSFGSPALLPVEVRSVVGVGDVIPPTAQPPIPPGAPAAPVPPPAPAAPPAR